MDLHFKPFTNTRWQRFCDFWNGVRITFGLWIAS